MDARAKRNGAEAVRRRLARALAPRGFLRTKTSFWTRQQEVVIHFIHLHLFTFAPSFRVHLGIRVLNDSFEAVALNGLASHDGWYGDRRQYMFEYSERNESIERCADNLLRFVDDVAIPWFERFVTAETLMTASGSPLAEDERAALGEALAGRSSESRVLASKVLLGVAQHAVAAAGASRRR